MASATWRRFLVASLVIIAAYRILPPSPVVRMVAYNGFAACCVAALSVATRQQRIKRRLAWYLITGGVLMFVLGDAIYTAWDPLLGTPPPFPNVGDAFYLACYPLLVGGLATLIRARTPGRDWASLIDATIIATGLGVLAWVFLIAPTRAIRACP
jgi:diguanylate cyclase